MTSPTIDRHSAFLSRTGLGGVADDENKRAKKCARLLEVPMILVALWIIIDWYLEAKGYPVDALEGLTDWITWLSFTAEAALLLTLVDDRWRYIKQNWLNLMIVAMGLPIIWGVEVFYAAGLRTLRMFIMLSIFVRLSTDVRRVLSKHHLGLTLFICFWIMVFSGLLISGIDPAFESASDGIWWAWVTVTTVGYGDLVPSTPEGRIFGALLILMGIGLFSMLTASFSVLFITQDEKKLHKEQLNSIHRVADIEKRLERIEQKLEQTLERLDRGP